MDGWILLQGYCCWHHPMFENSVVFWWRGECRFSRQFLASLLLLVFRRLVWGQVTAGYEPFHRECDGFFKVFFKVCTVIPHKSILG